MQNTSPLYDSILADDNHWFESQLIIDGVGTFGEDQLFSIETTTEALNNLPQVGIAAAGEINVKIAFPGSGGGTPIDPRTDIPPMAKLIPKVRVCHDSDDPDELHSEWLPQGIFFIDTREYTDCPDEIVVTFHGYDAMLKAEQYYPDTAHTWPYTDIDVVDEIADIMGISVDSRTYEWLTAAYQIPLPASYTMREVLENIAAAYAGNFVISAEGKLLFIPLCGFAEPTDFDYLADENGNALVFGNEGWCILV